MGVTPAEMRLVMATYGQGVVNIKCREWFYMHDSLIHRAEGLLGDSMEFDFARAELTEPQYDYIHTFSAFYYDGCDATKQEQGFTPAIQGLIVLDQAIEIMQRHTDADYQPSKDPKVLALHKGLKGAAQVAFEVGFLSLTASMLRCGGGPVVVEYYHTNRLREAIPFLQTCQVLLVRRGLGDGT